MSSTSVNVPSGTSAMHSPARRSRHGFVPVVSGAGPPAGDVADGVVGGLVVDDGTLDFVADAELLVVGAVVVCVLADVVDSADVGVEGWPLTWVPPPQPANTTHPPSTNGMMLRRKLTRFPCRRRTVSVGTTVSLVECESAACQVRPAMNPLPP
jgi:hypothetical protein